MILTNGIMFTSYSTVMSSTRNATAYVQLNTPAQAFVSFINNTRNTVPTVFSGSSSLYYNIPIAGKNGGGPDYASLAYGLVPTVNAGASANLGTTANNWLSLYNNRWFFAETTAFSAIAGYDTCYGDNSAHALKCSYNNDSFQNVARGQTAYLTSTYTNATTTASNIPGLSFAVAANTKYTMRCTLYYQGSVGTAGLDVTLTGPSAPTFVTWGYIEEATATGGAQDSVATAFGTKLTGAGTVTATTNLPSSVTMGLSNGANAGTVQVQGSASGVGTVTVQPGSFCLLSQ